MNTITRIVDLLFVWGCAAMAIYRYDHGDVHGVVWWSLATLVQTDRVHG